MFAKKLLFFVAGLVLAVTTVLSASGNTRTSAVQRKSQVVEPLNLAILIQDDLVSEVGNELDVTRDFIRSLPAGSQVMVGYVTSGSLQVRQAFTSDLDQAAKSLRIPTGSIASAPYNPYVELIEALKKFEVKSSNKNAVLLISDGLDVSRGFDSTAAAHTLDLDRAIKEANRRDVAVFSFYAPSVGLTSRSSLAASYGQSSLARLGQETGGRAFFQGSTGFVTFDSYFTRLREVLNDTYAKVR